MANRAHIVTMDEARATAQLGRQQSPTKQRTLGVSKKAAGKKAARTPGVRKLGQSPRAQQMPPRRDSRPLAPASPQRPSQPVARRASQPHGGLAAPARNPQPFAAKAPTRAARGQRDVFRFDEREERAAERAQAASQGVPEPDAPQRKRGPLVRLTERFGAKRHAAAKSRASRSFDRQYGGPAAPAPGEGGGPRAAVYQGQMGSSHKRASRSLASGALGAATAVASAATGRKRKEQSGRFPMKALVPAVVAVCLVATCAFMYGPVQLWYQQMRENDRLQIEYAALQERNGALQDDVASLSSEAGIEDRVHQQYGWVRDDEHAVSVSGLSTTDDIDFIANVSPGSIKPPETWYSGLLDPLFGVS